MHKLNGKGENKQVKRDEIHDKMSVCELHVLRKTLRNECKAKPFRNAKRTLK